MAAVNSGSNRASSGDKLKAVLDVPTRVIIGAVVSIAIFLVVYGAFWAVDHLPATLKSIGAAATSTPINAPSFLNGIITVFLGSGAVVSWENLILHIAIFMILFFALSDIVALFSTFSETTSWVIGFGLAIVAGVTKVIDYVAGVFAITSGIGAVGIGIIVLAAIVVAVLLNLGIGGPLRRWRTARQIEINTFKSAKGFNKVADFISGAKKASEVAGAGEKR